MRSAGLQRFLVQCPDSQVRRDPRKLPGRPRRTLAGVDGAATNCLPRCPTPLTANGKIDHQALKQRHTPEAENRAEADLPRGDIEKQVATLWQQLLSTGPVTRETDFSNKAAIVYRWLPV